MSDLHHVYSGKHEWKQLFLSDSVKLLEIFDCCLELEEILDAESSLSVFELWYERKSHSSFFMKSRDKILSEFSILVIFLDLVSEISDFWCDLWCDCWFHIKVSDDELFFLWLEPCFEVSLNLVCWNIISAHFDSSCCLLPLSDFDHIFLEILSVLEFLSSFLVSLFSSSDFHFLCDSCDHMWKGLEWRLKTFELRK